MKRTVLLAFSLILTTWLGAQRVSYTVLQDNTEDMKNVFIYLDPFYGEAWKGDRMSIGWKVGAMWQINDKIQAEFNLQKPFGEGGDLAYRDAAVFAPAHNAQYDNLKPMSVLNLVGSYALVEGEVRKPVKIALSSSSNGQVRTTTYIQPEANVKRSLSARGGICRYNSTLLFGGSGDDDGPFITADGEQMHLYGISDSEGNDIVDGSSQNLGWATNQRSLCVVGGLELRSQTNVIIDAEGYGEKSNVMVRQFYVDALFAPSPQIDDVTYEDMTFAVTGDFESALKTSNLGWRAGMRVLNAKRLFNWGWAAEIGSRPGYDGKGLFLNWSVSIPVVAFKVPSLSIKS